MNLIDTALVTERRITLGLSPAALAKRIRRSTTVVEALERGDNHTELPLGVVRELGEVLGLQLHDLVLRSGGTAEAEPDDIVVEAAIATLGRVAAADLAVGLGWPLARTRGALDRLRERLRPTGVALRQHAGAWSMVPRTAVLGRDGMRGIERAQLRRRRMTKYDVLVLRELVAGHITKRWASNATEARRVSLGRLLRLGYASPTNTGFEAAAEVRESLLITRSPKTKRASRRPPRAEQH